MNSKQQRPLKKLLGIRGMGAALTAFVGLIIIYIAFGIINPAVFSGQNMLNLLRSMSKYLLIGIAQSYVLITGNIDLSIGSMVGMSAMIAATLMTTGMVPFLAIVIALIACLVVGVVNGYLVGKFKLPPFIATLGTMFVARGIAYMVNGNRNTDAIATGVGKETADAFQNCFYYGKTLGIYNTFWIALVIFVIFFFILSKTRTFHHSKDLSGKLRMLLCSWSYPLRTGWYGKYGSWKHVRDVWRSSRRNRWRFPTWRNWNPSWNLRRCSCLADSGKWSEHDRCTSWYPASCNRRDRSCSRIAGCSCKKRTVWQTQKKITARKQYFSQENEIDN